MEMKNKVFVVTAGQKQVVALVGVFLVISIIICVMGVVLTAPL
jgi:hypothetical protein